MPFVDIDKLSVTERLPGWRGRYFHAANMTVAHYEFTRGASIHEHHHPQEELYEVLEGELEVSVDGVTQVARFGEARIRLACGATPISRVSRRPWNQPRPSHIATDHYLRTEQDQPNGARSTETAAFDHPAS